MKNEKNVNVSAGVVSGVYKCVRTVVCEYFYCSCQLELLEEGNGDKTCLIDENNFTHTKSGKAIWVLVIIEKESKQFRLEVSLNRDTTAIKKICG